MATIQIRNVPEEVHRIYRARAAAAGMSLQEFILAELEENARYRRPAEVVREVRERMRVEGPDGYPLDSSWTDIRSDRDRR
jgi:antitoxin FitA